MDINIRNHYEQAARDIMRLTGLNEMQYNTLLFERGIEYLSAECRGDQFGIGMMSRTEVYWQWWKNVWGNRNLAWLEMVREGKTFSGRKSYELYQSIEKIDSYPTTMIYRKAYSLLMKKIH